MPTDSTEVLVTEYARLLQSFGHSLSEIGRLHGINPQSVLDYNVLGAALREEVGPLSAETLHELLFDTLRRSDRGFGADRQYWNRLPAVQLADALDTAGYRFGIRSPADAPPDVCSTEEGPIDLGLWPADGGPVSHTTFEYPDSPLDDDNYPALIHCVNEQLLDGTGIQFVLLNDQRTDWQFFLLPTDLLETLKQRYGPRVAWRGSPLLRADQPVAFKNGVPESLDIGHDRASDGKSIDRSHATFDDIAASTASTQTESFDHGDADEPSADELANATDPTALVTDGAGDAVSDMGTEAASFFATFDESVEPPSPERRPEQQLETDWHVEHPIDNPDGLDSVFDQLERTAVTTPVDAQDDHRYHVPSSEVLDRIDHENVGENSTLKDGFLWVDPDELTAAPWQVHDAMTRG